MKEPVQLQVLYWAVAFLIALITAAFKAAGLRGSLNETWADRVDVLKTGVVQGALQELKTLRERIDNLLGGEADMYESITADPAVLLNSVRRFERLIRVQRTISSQFDWLLRLGNIMVFALLSMVLGVIALALQLSNVLQIGYLMIIGGVLLGAGAVVGLLCFLMYWVLQSRLSGAELLAQSVSK